MDISDKIVEMKRSSLFYYLNKKINKILEKELYKEKSR